MPWTPAEAPLDLALAGALACCLPGGRLAGPLVAFRSVPSTQALARAWAAAGAPEGAVVLADHQSAGRGRRGRSWTAPPGAGLLFSVVLRPTLPVARWPEIPLAAGCAVAEALEAVGPVTTRLKWPNDVLAGGRKLAGVLAEGVAGGEPTVVLGIGVNVSQRETDWPPELAGRAVSLAALGAPLGREAVLRAVLGRVEAWYETLVVRGFAPVREAWRGRGIVGHPVTIGGAGEAEAIDLAPGGGLVARRSGGVTTVITAGEPLEPVPPVGAAPTALPGSAG